MSTFNQQVPQPENGFQSLAEVFQRASRGQKRDAEKQGEETRKKFELDIEPEEFKSDYKSRMISTSEVCELLTQRLGDIFGDYVGCRELSYVNSPVIGISLVFDPAINPETKSLKALETCGFDSGASETKEQEMIAKFNGINAIKSSSANGIVSEDSMGFRLTNDAIEILKETVVDFGLNDNKNNDTFRKQCVQYALSADGTHNILIVNGATIESVLGFIYGNQYDYVVIPGAPINNGSFSGRLLDVRQLDPKVTKNLLKKYVSRQVVSDGLYRPTNR